MNSQVGYLVQVTMNYVHAIIVSSNDQDILKLKPFESKQYNVFFFLSADPEKMLNDG
jgi:hypothetical protein